MGDRVKINIGDRFGRWEVVEEAPPAKNRSQCWSCRCICGESRAVRQASLSSGESQSCGLCINSEKAAKVGDRFGRLEIISIAPPNSDGRRKWLCKCACGTDSPHLETHLKNGHTKSCGCIQKTHAVIHGLSRSPEFSAWTAMKQRCNNPKDKRFADYGGRGITVCERWGSSFEAFLEDMGKRPSKHHTLERDDNELGYNQENCVWATKGQQNRNKRNNRPITINGVTRCATDWAVDNGINPTTALVRLFHGWDEETAVTTPVGGIHRWNSPRLAKKAS